MLKLKQTKMAATEPELENELVQQFDLRPNPFPERQNLLSGQFYREIRRLDFKVEQIKAAMKELQQQMSLMTHVMQEQNHQLNAKMDQFIHLTLKDTGLHSSDTEDASKIEPPEDQMITTMTKPPTTKCQSLAKAPMFESSVDMLEVREAIIREEVEVITAMVEENVFKILPALLNPRVTSDESPITFTPAKAETEETHQNFHAIHSEMHKDFKKMEGRCVEMRHFLRSVAFRSNNRVTESALIDLVVSQATGDFHDVLTNIFNNSPDINHALNTIMKIFGQSLSPLEKLARFRQAKIDLEHLEDSLLQCYSCCLLAYPTLKPEEIDDKLIDHVLRQVPPWIARIVDTEMLKLRRLSQVIGKEVKLEYGDLLDLMKEALYQKEITDMSLEETESTLSGQSYQALLEVSMDDDDDEMSLIPVTTPDQACLPNPLNESKPANQRRKCQKRTLLTMDYPGIGQVFQHINHDQPDIIRTSQINYQKRNKSSFPEFKKANIPRKPIPYLYDDHDMIIPEAKAINFAVLI